jgi:hypothetical protein
MASNHPSWTESTIAGCDLTPQILITFSIGAENTLAVLLEKNK